MDQSVVKESKPNQALLVAGDRVGQVSTMQATPMQQRRTKISSYKLTAADVRQLIGKARGDLSRNHQLSQRRAELCILYEEAITANRQCAHLSLELSTEFYKWEEKFSCDHSELLSTISTSIASEIWMQMTESREKMLKELSAELKKAWGQCLSEVRETLMAYDRSNRSADESIKVTTQPAVKRKVNQEQAVRTAKAAGAISSVKCLTSTRLPVVFLSAVTTSSSGKTTSSASPSSFPICNQLLGDPTTEQVAERPSVRSEIPSGDPSSSNVTSYTSDEGPSSSKKVRAKSTAYRATDIATWACSTGPPPFMHLQSTISDPNLILSVVSYEVIVLFDHTCSSQFPSSAVASLAKGESTKPTALANFSIYHQAGVTKLFDSQWSVQSSPSKSPEKTLRCPIFKLSEHVKKRREIELRASVLFKLLFCNLSNSFDCSSRFNIINPPIDPALSQRPSAKLLSKNYLNHPGLTSHEKFAEALQFATVLMSVNGSAVTLLSAVTLCCSFVKSADCLGLMRRRRMLRPVVSEVRTFPLPSTKSHESSPFVVWDPARSKGSSCNFRRSKDPVRASLFCQESTGSPPTRPSLQWMCQPAANTRRAEPSIIHFECLAKPSPIMEMAMSSASPGALMLIGEVTSTENKSFIVQALFRSGPVRTPTGTRYFDTSAQFKSRSLTVPSCSPVARSKLIAGEFSALEVSSFLGKMIPVVARLTAFDPVSEGDSMKKFSQPGIVLQEVSGQNLKFPDPSLEHLFIHPTDCQELPFVRVGTVKIQWQLNRDQERGSKHASEQLGPAVTKASLGWCL